MASQTLTTNAVTFLDYTDNRKLEVYITSSLPQVQIYNPNDGLYTPDWSVDDLLLSAKVFLDSEEITTATLKWSEKIGSNNTTELTETSNQVLITSNKMTGTVVSTTYICEATYQGLSARAQIDFTRLNTGTNGSAGQDGADGTSIIIKDTAYYNGMLGEEHTGELVVLYTDSTYLTLLSTQGLSDGDSYIAQGYLCIYNSTRNGFVCTGKIQGPKGADAKNIILSANSQVFKVDKDGATIVPARITVTATTINTSITTWLYAENGGELSETKPSWVTFNNGQIIIKGSDMTAKTLTIKATDGTHSDVFTIYKIADGIGIASTTITYGVSDSSDVKPTSWQNTIPAVADGEYLWTRTIIDYTDTTRDDTVSYTYAKQGIQGKAGLPGTSVTVSSIQYQAGTSATTAPTGTWSNSVVTVAEGSYLWTKTTFSDGNVAYGVAKQGVKGSAGINAITFQIYAPNGYLLSNEVESLTLQTFAYDGSAAITSATYAWSYQENDTWVAISNAATNSLTLTKDDVIKSKTYRCAMTYKNTTYYATATVQDKSDIYDVMICVSDNINPLTGVYYWVVYALLYSEQGEADALLGPISTNAPTSPTSGDYWYAIDTTTQTVTLKKYNGSAWETSTDKQAYAYDWRQITDGTQQQAIGNTDKVQIISCNSFTSSATFQCIVTDTDGSKLARCNIHLTDTSDPIISATAPVGVKDGQLWMQTQTDGTFLLYIWDADTSIWKQLNADTKNVVYTSKPSSYKSGDLWVVESDTAIDGYIKGTLLQSNATTTTFDPEHWTPSLRYESELAEVQNALKSYKQYMSVDSDGLHMQAKNADGTLSPFQALFTNTRLSFYQDDLEVAYISDNKLNINEANIDVLSVEKKIQLQKFEWAIESNGSMSLIVNY